MADISPKALVIGAAMVDIVCNVDRLPQSGEGVVPRSVTKTVGGCALNSAAMLQYLGVNPVLFAPVGEGLFATLVKEAIAALGLSPFEPSAKLSSAKLPSVLRASGGEAPSNESLANAALSNPEQPSGNDSSSQETPYDCGACLCLVEPDGERTMITIPGIERHFTSRWFSALPDATLNTLQAAIVCGYELETPGGDDILTFLEAHPALQIFYAPGPRVCAVSPERVKRLQALHAIWHLNDQEACAYTGITNLEQAGCTLAQQAQAPVIVTAGAQGSYVFMPQNMATSDNSVFGESAHNTTDCLRNAPSQTSNSGAVDVPSGKQPDQPKQPNADARGIAVEVNFVPSIPVHPVNTVGAGDAHLGAVVAGWIQGCAWLDILTRANEMAARVCLKEGTTLRD